MLPDNKITLSIVSHGQSSLIEPLLIDLSRLTASTIEVIITVNIPEEMSVYQNSPIPIKIIRNDVPKGFGENHNAAFQISITKWFAVVNPDIRISSLNIDRLLAPFVDDQVAVVGPVVLSSKGAVEDSARKFPTFLGLLQRTLKLSPKLDYSFDSVLYGVDWVAGMFMVFRGSAFNDVKGFDSHRFFMYMEDADICRRLGLRGYTVIYNGEISVTHLAQRASKRNLKHLCWHLVSSFRFLTRL